MVSSSPSVVSMPDVELRPVRAPRTGRLPYKGGSHQRFIEYIYGLSPTNPLAHGKVIST